MIQWRVCLGSNPVIRNSANVFRFGLDSGHPIRCVYDYTAWYARCGRASREGLEVLLAVPLGSKSAIKGTVSTVACRRRRRVRLTHNIRWPSLGVSVPKGRRYNVCPRSHSKLPLPCNDERFANERRQPNFIAKWLRGGCPPGLYRYARLSASHRGFSQVGYWAMAGLHLWP